ncbi:CoA transferase [Dactylosporangium sp. NPDC000555]|uniref:CaiB/BaiF CoA transferase family protein n=1 Tax=Dactylosporangium sp. NPDC000555 TaxID=3154260 RepID=UPI0033279CEC
MAWPARCPIGGIEGGHRVVELSSEGVTAKRTKTVGEPNPAGGGPCAASSACPGTDVRLKCIQDTTAQSSFPGHEHEQSEAPSTSEGWKIGVTSDGAPLAGVRVLDLTTYLPGPYATLLLADLGADVIHVERPGGEPGRHIEPRVGDDSALHAWVGRNKRSIQLNLKDDEDRDRLRTLVSDCDVIVEGFTVGVAARLGFDYESCRAVNPRVVYCSISVAGQHGHNPGTPGHDINFLARAGFLGQVRDSAGAPVPVGSPIADLAAGLHAAVGIVAALLHRERSGEGQFVDVSLLGSAVALTGPQLVKALAADPPRLERDFNLGSDAGYTTYQCRDGRWIAIGALEDHFWSRLCRLLDRDDLIQSRASRPDAAIEQLSAVFATADRDHWDALLGDANVCYAPINDMAEAAVDPYLTAGQDIVTVGLSRQPNSPIRLPGSAGRGHSPAPGLSSQDVNWCPRPE